MEHYEIYESLTDLPATLDLFSYSGTYKDRNK